MGAQVSSARLKSAPGSGRWTGSALGIPGLENQELHRGQGVG